MSEGIHHHTEFEQLLEYLKHNRNFDFTGYKRTTLVRRIDKRMQEVAVADYSSYIDYLEVHPDEFTRLFNTILINVTGFFRDMSAWEFVDQQVIPRILASKKAQDPIRIWSAAAHLVKKPSPSPCCWQKSWPRRFFART